MLAFWNSLYDKVRSALLWALALDGVYLIAALNGSTSWRDAAIAAATTDIPVLAAYRTKETKTPA